MIVLKIFNLLWVTVKTVALGPLLILPAWWLCLLIIANLRPILRGWLLTNGPKVKT